jgi:leucyl aminopeptidase
LKASAAGDAALGWALAAYRFTRYRAGEDMQADLVWPSACDRAAVESAALATYLVRDLINTPASDMGPGELAAAARKLGRDFGARCRVVAGPALLRDNYPAIHAVGRASSRAPRLVDLTWGDRRAPKVTLVGKGVCFDSGGLDLKSAQHMKLMKKDMGGAATVLGLARMIMAADLPVRLRVLVPAVENSVSGDAMRPLDVVATRRGLSVEIGNTDAEGRVVLADALSAAAAEKPDLLIDCATLTGAARVALGGELPALFSNHDATAEALLKSAAQASDPLWRLPLWDPYRRHLESPVADLTNAPDEPLAGAITAALFLAEFVDDGIPWVHLDLMAWNTSARPGRPKGGEAMGMRALFGLVENRFGPRPRSARRRPRPKN